MNTHTQQVKSLQHSGGGLTWKLLIDEMDVYVRVLLKKERTNKQIDGWKIGLVGKKKWEKNRH
jgi:hypothetical protein